MEGKWNKDVVHGWFLFFLTRQTKDKNASGTGKRFVRRGVENYTR